MSVIKGIRSAIKEDKVSEWLRDNDRKVEINALGNEVAKAAFEVYPNNIGSDAIEFNTQLAKDIRDSRENSIGGAASKIYLDEIEQERCKSVQESVDGCEYEGIKSDAKDKQAFFNTAISDLIAEGCDSEGLNELEKITTGTEIKPKYFHVNEDGEASRVEVGDLNFSSCTYPTGFKVMIEDGEVILKQWGWFDGVETWMDVK